VQRIVNVADRGYGLALELTGTACGGKRQEGDTSLDLGIGYSTGQVSDSCEHSNEKLSNMTG